jgi:hypothetical protein
MFLGPENQLFLAKIRLCTGTLPKYWETSFLRATIPHAVVLSQRGCILHGIGPNDTICPPTDPPSRQSTRWYICFDLGTYFARRFVRMCTAKSIWARPCVRPYFRTNVGALLHTPLTFAHSPIFWVLASWTDKILYATKCNALLYTLDAPTTDGSLRCMCWFDRVTRVLGFGRGFCLLRAILLWACPGSMFSILFRSI